MRKTCQMALPDRVRLPFAFDAAVLAADLDRFGAGDWTAHFVRQNYEGAWSALPLRSPAGETHPIRMIYADPTATRFVDTALLERTPSFREVLDRFQCPLKTVRLMQLSPGSTIKEHCDPDIDADNGYARLHIPITTSAEVTFLLNQRPLAMTPGSVWSLRLSDPHSVVNRGTSSRVHLVIDAEVNSWLTDILRAAAVRVRPPRSPGHAARRA